MAAIVNLLNINGDAPGRLFERWTTTSLVSLHFLGEEKLAKICSKSVCRKQPELLTHLNLQYISAMAARVNQLNINVDAPGRMFERWIPTSLIPIHFLGGEELVKISSKNVRCTQPELHTRLLLQYASAMTAIVNQLNINGDAPNRMFERWTPTRMVPMHFLGG